LDNIASQLVGTTQARKRTALALGDNVVAELSQYLLQRIEAAGKAVAAPVLSRGAARAKRVEQITTRGQKVRATEAEKLGTELAGQTQRATQLAEVEKAAKAGVAAMGDFTAGRGFAATVPQTLGEAGRREVSGVMAGELQDQLRGLSPQEAIKKLQEYQQNPAARSFFGPALDQAVERLRPRQSALPSLRAALIGQAAGRM
jgi:hypothetical protein